MCSCTFGSRAGCKPCVEKQWRLMDFWNASLAYSEKPPLVESIADISSVCLPLSDEQRSKMEPVRDSRPQCSADYSVCLLMSVWVHWHGQEICVNTTTHTLVCFMLQLVIERKRKTDWIECCFTTKLILCCALYNDFTTLHALFSHVYTVIIAKIKMLKFLINVFNSFLY